MSGKYAVGRVSIDTRGPHIVPGVAQTFGAALRALPAVAELQERLGLLEALVNEQAALIHQSDVHADRLERALTEIAALAARAERQGVNGAFALAVQGVATRALTGAA